MHSFHSMIAATRFHRCVTCLENFPNVSVISRTAECRRCHMDKHIPKLCSSANNMDPGKVSPQLQVCQYSTFINTLVVSFLFLFMQGLTQIEEMLISAVMPIMSIYRLPHGQYGYSGHVVNLPQDVLSFATSLPRLPSEIDVLVVKKEKDQTHKDFRVRRHVVQQALSWLLQNHRYY